MIDVRRNVAAKGEFLACLRASINEIGSVLGGPRESADERPQYVGVLGLYVFFISQWQDPSDRKLFRAIWSLLRESPTLPLYACTRLNVSAFLQVPISFFSFSFVFLCFICDGGFLIVLISA